MKFGASLLYSGQSCKAGISLFSFVHAGKRGSEHRFGSTHRDPPKCGNRRGGRSREWRKTLRESGLTDCRRPLYCAVVHKLGWLGRLSTLWQPEVPMISVEFLPRDRRPRAGRPRGCPSMTGAVPRACRVGNVRGQSDGGERRFRRVPGAAVRGRALCASPAY